jgi:hypothetical protein
MKNSRVKCWWNWLQNEQRKSSGAKAAIKCRWNWFQSHEDYLIFDYLGYTLNVMLNAFCWFNPIFLISLSLRLQERLRFFYFRLGPFITNAIFFLVFQTLKLNSKQRKIEKKSSFASNNIFWNMFQRLKIRTR